MYPLINVKRKIFLTILFYRPVKTDIPEEYDDESEDVMEMLPKSPNMDRKQKLRKQMSVMEVPSDECGLFKMTHWV